MANLKITYKDDVLDASVNEKRKYNMIQNADGTVSFEDVTVYSQVGDSFGAADINATNEMLEKVNSNLTASDDLKFRFATDGEGNYGFLGADDSFIPFFSNDAGILKDFTAMTDVGSMYYISKSCVITDSKAYLYFAPTLYDGNFGLGAYSTPLYDFTKYSKLKITGIISCTTNYTMYTEIGYGASVSVGTGGGNTLVLTDGDKQVYESTNEIQIIDKEFDISSITGNHLIAFGCYARGAQYCNTKMLITSIILS